MSWRRGGKPTVIRADADGRADVLVAHAIGGWSRRRVHELFERGAVSINGRRARKGDRVQAGDVVAVDVAVLPAALAGSAALPVRLLHVDEELIAVDKPAGMPSVALRTGDTGTVANFLVGRFPELREVSANPLEAGLLHRLDSATSGVLLAARSAAVYARWRPRFARTAVKDYVAVVRGAGPRRERIALPIAHVPRRPRRMRVCDDPAVARDLSARPAETVYRTIQSDADGAWLAVRIRTGVRHQIRVHLAARGRAIIGDALYDRRGAEPHAAQRLLLHAYRLRLPRESGGVAFDCVAELPADFAAVLRARGWRLPLPSDWDDV